jgi:(E)-4-hydroxy-3-methylbut-2-enyl-diphosphate synthase
MELPSKYVVVQIGDLLLGGDNPIRIQSMANADTLNTRACVEQAVRIIKAGGDMIRFTTQGIREAENLINIKNELHKLSYKIPLIADVHFNPRVAEVAASIVEKVRINPGNYTDKKQFRQVDFSDKENKEELERIHSRILPLIKICKANGTAIRIGVNHGSLSDRIMSRFGDTPEGMLESALEFLTIFKSEGFDQLVISMKSSNTRVMMQATRLLFYQMKEEGILYPIHLGLTEAGDGEDGRIKSAAGIGTLLAEGIGDTIRVSLTEAPESEIPVAIKLSDRSLRQKKEIPVNRFQISTVNPVSYTRRKSIALKNIGGSKIPVILSDKLYSDTSSAGEYLPELIYFEPVPEKEYISTDSQILISWDSWMILNSSLRKNYLPLVPSNAYCEGLAVDLPLRFVLTDAKNINEKLISQLSKDKNVILVLQSFEPDAVFRIRRVFEQLGQAACEVPVIINFNYSEEDLESLQVKAAADFGCLLLDGLGDGIWLRNSGSINQNSVFSIAKGILQACRMRTFRTEYISCPSCGRTLFDITATLHQIRQKTSHLSHLKIAVMGCIVNGPGEMADADYGYVGAGPDKVTLYKSKEVVKKNIPAAEAVEELINLIKLNGDWLEPGNS